MKTDIKNRIQEIMSAHKATNAPHIATIAAWEKDTVYSDSYKREQIKAIKAKIAANDLAANQQIKVAITEAKNAVFGSPVTKPADYQQQIANALEFIKLAGNKLNDDQAAKILNPFQGDVETMNLFRSVIDNTARGGIANRFEKTFGEVDNVIALTNNFADAENMADTFINSNDSSLNYAVHYGIFMGKIDAIEEGCEQA